MKISKRHQVLFWASGVILIPLLFQFLVVAPLQEQRELLTTDIRDLHAKSGLLDDQIGSLIKNGARRRSLEDEGLEGALLSKNSSIELITRIENLAAAYHVESALLFENDIDTKQNALQEVATTIRAQGTYSNLLHFLRAIEQEPFYIVGNSIRLVPANAPDTAEKILELTINAKTTWK